MPTVSSAAKVKRGLATPLASVHPNTASSTPHRSAAKRGTALFTILDGAERTEKKDDKAPAAAAVDGPTLRLVKFADVPWVNFGEIKAAIPGKAAVEEVRTLTLCLPEGGARGDVVFEKLPPTDCGVTVRVADGEGGTLAEGDQVNVPPGGRVKLEVVWCTNTAAGGARHTLGLKWAGKYRLQAIVHGTVVAPLEGKGGVKKGVKSRRGAVNTTGNTSVNVTNSSSNNNNNNNSAVIDQSKVAMVKAASKAALKSGPAVAQRRLNLKRSAGGSGAVRTANASVLNASSASSVQAGVFRAQRQAAHLAREAGGFVRWINHVVAPVPTLASAAAIAAATSSIFARGADVDDLTSNRRASLGALLRHRETERLRHRATRLLGDPSVASPVERISRAIDTGELSVRGEVHSYEDVGVAARLEDLAMAYDPRWLRVGLEAVFSERISGHSDDATLRAFVKARLVCEKLPVREAARDAVRLTVATETLRHFLALAVFLDVAKAGGADGTRSGAASLIDGDPPLFRRGSTVKSSRDLVVNLCRALMRGEGDVVKHLAKLGWRPTVAQTPLDEYDFSVSNLATDLRDGVRLGRLVERLSGSATGSITGKLRVTESDRDGDVLTDAARRHMSANVSIVFKELDSLGCKVNRRFVCAPEDVAEGRRERTVALLWRIAAHWQLSPRLTDPEAIRTEARRVASGTDDGDNKSNDDNNDDAMIGTNGELLIVGDRDGDEVADALRAWVAAVCARHGLAVANLTSAWASGAAACVVISHYLPSVLPASKIDFSNEAAAAGNGDAPKADELGHSESTGGWSASFSPGSLAERHDARLRRARSSNVALACNAARRIGGVPDVLQCPTGDEPCDERLIVLFLSHLFPRLTELRGESRAAGVIGRWWRAQSARAEGARIRSEMIRVRCAVAIQSAARGFLARTAFAKSVAGVVAIQSAFRGYVERRKYARACRGVVSIQSLVRVYLAKRAYARSVSGVVSTQSLVRGYIARKAFAKDVESVVAVQSAVRGYLARRDYARTRSAAVAIQAAVRGRIARNAFSRALSGIIAIQSAVRGYIARKSHAKTVGGIVAVQSVVRGFIARRAFLRSRAAAIVIQSVVRGHIARSAYAESVTDVVIVQCIARGFLARRAYARAISAVVTIQSAVRGYLAKKCHAKTIGGIVAVQSLVRGFIARRVFAKDVKSVVTVQSIARGFLARRAYVKCVAGVVAIQSAVRGYLARVHHAKNVDCVVSIQSLVRGFIARRAFAKDVRSVVTVQSIARGYIAKRDYARTINSIVTMQSAVRGYLARVHHAKNVDCVVSIQSLVRGFIARRTFAKDVRSVVTVQSLARGYIAKRDYARTRSAVVAIQSAYRRSIAVRTYAQSARAVVAIQSAVRGFIARKAFAKDIRGVVSIQSLFRGAIARKEFATSIRAVVTIQSAFRRRSAVVGYARAVRCVVTVQSLARGRIARARYASSVAGVVAIQSAFRTAIARSNYARTRRAIVTIQAAYRRSVAVRKFAASARAVVSIQSLVRGFLARSALRRNASAAVAIQSAFRGFAARRSFAAKRHAAIAIQSAWRKHTAVAAMSRAKSAAVVIQSAVRRHFARESFRAAVGAAVAIQSAFRGRLARKALARSTRAAGVIQTAFRAHRARVAERIAHESASAIQRAVRRFQSRRWERDIESRKTAVAVISRAYRRHSLRNSATGIVRMRRSAVTIQAVFRAHLVRVKDDQKRKEMRERIAQVNASADVRQTLGHRASRALSILLTHPSMTVVLKSANALLSATSLSHAVRVRITEMGAAELLADLIGRRCNRSTPGREVLRCALGVLSQLASDPVTAPAVAECQLTIPSVVGQMPSIAHDAPGPHSTNNSDMLLSAIQVLSGACEVPGFADALGSNADAMSTVTALAKSIEARFKSQSARTEAAKCAAKKAAALKGLISKCRQAAR